MTSLLSRKLGSVVDFNEEKLTLVANVDFNKVRLKSSDGEFLTVSIDEIASQSEAVKAKSIPIDRIREDKHERYLTAFRPVLEKKGRTGSKVMEAAALLGISRSTAYNCLQRFDVSGDTRELPPPTRPGGRNKSRLNNPAVEKILDEEIPKVVQGIFRKPKAFIKAVKKRLSAKGLTVSESTLRSRFNGVSSFVRFKARKGKHEADQQLEPKAGHHPEVRAPFEMIQIDHWKIDVEILDDSRLHLIGRAWLTVGIDVYSRMIWGWHVGLDAPSTTPLALCMVNGLTPKTQMLRELGLDYDFPIAGTIKFLHADNAKEFRGNTIKAGCDSHGITLRWRPVKKPHYGQYIERYNGTLASKLKNAPGATGSSPEERKELQPEKTAAFTLADLRKHLCMIINEYHNERHATLGVTPLDKFKSFYLNSDGTQKRAFPPVIYDTIKLRLNWYPLTNRVVRQTGLKIDYLDYYGEPILDLVRHRKDLDGPVEVRRDPFDIRHIYLNHPTRQEWIEVPCGNGGCPPVSLYRLKEAAREANKRNREPTPEVLFELMRQQEAHVEAARKATKSARRAAVRDKDHRKIRQRSPTHARHPAEQEIIETTPRACDDFGNPAVSSDRDWDAILAELDKEEIE